MPAFSSGTLGRVLAAVARLQQDGNPACTLSAIRRVDGELRGRCPMGYATGARAVTMLVGLHALMVVQGDERDRVRLPAQRRASWTNEKRRETWYVSTAA